MLMYLNPKTGIPSWRSLLVKGQYRELVPPRDLTMVHVTAVKNEIQRSSLKRLKPSRN